MAKASKQPDSPKLEVVPKPEKSKVQTKIDELNKKYGSGTIVGAKSFPETLDVVSTGSISLNAALGIGGLPVGKLIELFGPESSGKSTLSLHFIAEFQKVLKPLGRKCVLINFESSFDRKYAKDIGVDIDDLLICQSDYMEDGYNIAKDLIETGEVGCVVMDSHTAGIPKGAQKEGSEIGDAKMALQARINSDALLQIHPLLFPYKATMISIAQLRTAIGSYGDPDKPSGGNAYKFYADIRMKVSKVVEKAEEQNKTIVEVIKNKCAPPFGKAEFKIQWGTGIDRLREIIDYAVEFDFIQRGGSWFTVGESKFQGVDGMKAFLLDNPEYMDGLEKKVMEEIMKTP